MSDAAVIVLDINGGAMLRACLDSIAAQTVPFAEVVVWDNSETNLGFTGGNNEAWTRTTSDFVALVNNDVVLDPDWLATVRGAMADDVGAVQTMLRGEAAAGIDISDGTIRQLVECGGHAAAGAFLPRRPSIGERRSASARSIRASSPTTKTSSSAPGCTRGGGGRSCCRW